MNNQINQQKKKQESQDPKRSKEIQYPIGLEIHEGKERKACEVCEKPKSDFYCTKCEIHYCKNCETQHNKELTLYCQDEKKIICAECFENCRTENYTIFGLNEYSNQISEKIQIILNKIQKEEKQNKQTIERALENQIKLRKEIKDISNEIKNG
ncbi:tripartite motif-containing protein [Anaeramoeba flamelloides]|uniref:Tripartite motif-containing protein n=1 Tax=Anaeramoeba flamelloides TaxID=1746091 RepID=A0ABQ8Y5S9_9EUKA|nr:tripartite motif-containing protein [Anaeramoeba flamelloides]